MVRGPSPGGVRIPQTTARTHLHPQLSGGKRAVGLVSRQLSKRRSRPQPPPQKKTWRSSRCGCIPLKVDFAPHELPEPQKKSASPPNHRKHGSHPAPTLPRPAPAHRPNDSARNGTVSFSLHVCGLVGCKMIYAG